MVSFAEELRDIDIEMSCLFDKECRHTMARMVPVSGDAMMNHANALTNVYEYHLFHYIVLDEFNLVCWTMVPTK